MDTPGPDKATPTPVKRTLARRIGRGLAFALLGVVILGLTTWMGLAVCYTGARGGTWRPLAGALTAVVMIAVVLFVRPRKIGLLVFALVFIAILGWFFSIRPSHDRQWQTDVAVLPHATIDGDLLHVFNVRNFDYHTETDYTPDYYDQTYDLRELESADVVLSYWSGRAIAHALLSFGFKGDRYLAISIETRKERGEEYTLLGGFFREYELIYVVADERDLIRLRTNYRKEDVYLYRTRATQEKARAVLLDYFRVINSIRDEPRFYNALTENCTTSLYAHLRCAPPYPPLTPGVLLSGYSAEYGYRSGGLDHSVPFDELERRSHINDLAQSADNAEDFSRRIRARVTRPVAPAEMN